MTPPDPRVAKVRVTPDGYVAWCPRCAYISPTTTKSAAKGLLERHKSTKKHRTNTAGPSPFVHS